MPGARRARSLACKKKHTSKVTTGTPKQSDIPCAMVTTCGATPVNRAFLRFVSACAITLIP